jgi:Ecdysteroid kinase-like family
VIPDRLSNEFFTKVLREAFKLTDPVTIESTNIQLATVAGDNYCSEIYRAVIVFSVQSKVQQISLIVKDMPPGEHRGAVLDDLKVYERETEMYCQTIPAMSKLLGNEFFSARCLFATDEPCKMMVFQDLKALGYQMADRKAGLDYEHCRMIMEKLGKFHATSMVLGERQPEVMRSYKYGMLDPNVRKNNDHLEKFFNGGLDMLIKVMGDWEGYESILERLRKIRVSELEIFKSKCSFAHSI